MKPKGHYAPVIHEKQIDDNVDIVVIGAHSKCKKYNKQEPDAMDFENALYGSVKSSEVLKCRVTFDHK
jgi:hypothetical protein